MGESVIAPTDAPKDPTIEEKGLQNDHGNDSAAEDNEGHLNPRNWSVWKKRLVFSSLMSSSILADGYAGPLCLVPKPEHDSS